MPFPFAAVAAALPEGFGSTLAPSLSSGPSNAQQRTGGINFYPQGAAGNNFVPLALIAVMGVLAYGFIRRK